MIRDVEADVDAAPPALVIDPGVMATVRGPVTPSAGVASIVREIAAADDSAAIWPRIEPRSSGKSVAPARRLPHCEQYARWSAFGWEQCRQTCMAVVSLAQSCYRFVMNA